MSSANFVYQAQPRVPGVRVPRRHHVDQRRDRRRPARPSALIADVRNYFFAGHQHRHATSGPRRRWAHLHGDRAPERHRSGVPGRCSATSGELVDDTAQRCRSGLASDDRRIGPTIVGRWRSSATLRRGRNRVDTLPARCWMTLFGAYRSHSSGLRFIGRSVDPTASDPSKRAPQSARCPQMRATAPTRRADRRRHRSDGAARDTPAHVRYGGLTANSTGRPQGRGRERSSV